MCLQFKSFEFISLFKLRPSICYSDRVSAVLLANIVYFSPSLSISQFALFFIHFKNKSIVGIGFVVAEAV